MLVTFAVIFCFSSVLLCFCCTGKANHKKQSNREKRSSANRSARDTVSNLELSVVDTSPLPSPKKYKSTSTLDEASQHTGRISRSTSRRGYKKDASQRKGIIAAGPGITNRAVRTNTNVTSPTVSTHTTATDLFQGADMSFTNSKCWRATWGRRDAERDPPPPGFAVIRPSSQVGEYAVSYTPANTSQVLHTKVMIQNDRFCFNDLAGNLHEFDSVFDILEYLAVDPYIESYYDTAADIVIPLRVVEEETAVPRSEAKAEREDLVSDGAQLRLGDTIVDMRRKTNDTKEDIYADLKAVNAEKLASGGIGDVFQPPPYEVSVLTPSVFDHVTMLLAAVTFTFQTTTLQSFTTLTHSQLIVNNWDIDLKELTLGAELGRGSFGVVNLGVYKGFYVAVKTLKTAAGKDLTAKDIKAFKKESDIMAALPLHENVLRLIGVNTDLSKGSICFLVEYCPRGSLDVVLAEEQFDRAEKNSFLLGTARGVQFLHQNSIIHRDLAARNLLLTNENVVKIADFGMSRHLELDGGNTKNNVGPLRYMAPEAMVNQEYSEKTDAWSWGVVAWEIESDGEQPFRGVNPAKVAMMVCNDGVRLQRPSATPKALFNIISHCWIEDPDERPDFNSIVPQLEQFIRKATGKAPEPPQSMYEDITDVLVL